MTTPAPKTKRNLFGLTLDILIDFGLIALGVLLYIHFQVRALAPLDLNPVVYQYVGGRQVATLLIAAIPFVFGLFGLARSAFRAARHKGQ